MKKPLIRSIFLLLLLFASFKVSAEGSKELAANGGDRAHWRSSIAISPQFPFPSFAVIKVYANVGETIFLGSSAQGYVGSTTGTINWKAPDQSAGTSGTSTTIGRIQNRAQEAFGPSLTIGDGGYNPYAVVVGAGQEGVWEITFISTSLTAAGGNAPISPVNDELAQNPNGFYIEAFDVSVKNTANALVPGRAFMNIFSGNTSNVANNYGSFNGIFHVLTKDGYKYIVNANGMQGAAFQFFSNNKGFMDTNGNASYKSVLNVGTTAATIPVHNPTTADDATNVTHKLFFNPPAPDLPATALSASGPVWLNTPIITPTLSNFSFTGTEGTSNLAGTAPLGGSFSFRSSVTGAYKISIDINKNGSFADPDDRFITGYANVINTDIVTLWDGLDGLGVKVPGNTTFPPGTIKIELLSGEVHFPLLDVEKNPNGIIVTRLNGNSPDDVLYWDDSNITNAGIPSNPRKNLTGINSSTNGHIWSGTGANNFGDNNGMDSWGYIPSTPLNNPLAFRIAEADLEVISITSNPTAICQGTTASFQVTVRNNGPDNVTGAKFHIDLPAGLSNTVLTSTSTVGLAQVVSPALTVASYDAILNMENAAVLVFTINATISTLPPAGFLVFKASVLRPADVTDPDATNPDNAIPTDPDQECNSTPSGVGCNNIKNVQITVNAALVTAPVSTVVQPTCAVATGSITVTAPVGTGFTYSIDGITYQASPVFNGVIPGTYSVKVKSAGGCESPVASVTINPQPATPVAATATAVQPTCAVATGSITVTAPTGTGLTYSVDGITYQPTPTFTGLAAGTYSLTVQNTSGCVSPSTSIVINPQPATPVAATATAVQPTCAVATGSITVTAPTGTGLTYSVDGVTYQATPTFTGLAAGTYSLTVQNTTGCISAPTSIVINTQPATPVAATATAVQPTCAVATGSITVTAPTGTGLTYSVDGITYQATPNFTGLAAGTYSLTVQNAGGCISAPTSIVINTQPATPVAATATAVQPTCTVATGSITVTAPIGTGLTYSVDGVTYQSAPNFTGLAAGTYSLTVQNADGCVSPPTSIVINPQPATPVAATATAVQPTCAVATGSITVTAPTGTGLTYSVDGITYQATPIFTGLAAGTYSLTVQNAGGCVSPPTSIVINPQPATPVAATATAVQPTCAVVTGSITVTAPTGAGLTYSVDGITYQATPNFTGLSAGTYSLTVQNTTGCISAPTSIVINPQPATPVAATVTTVQPTCTVATGSITVTAPTGTGLTYSVDGITYQPTPTFTGLVAGTYSLTVQNAGSCVSPPTSIVINPQPATPVAATATAVQPTCAVATGSITVTAPTGTGLTYSVDGIAYQSAPTFTGLAAGTYSLTVQNTTGCVSPPTSIVINPQPAAPSPPVVRNISYCQGDPAIALQATGQQIKWYLTETSVNPLPSPPIPETANPGVTIWWSSQTSSGGCESARTPLTVTVNAKPVLTLISSTTDMAITDQPRLLEATPAGGIFTGEGVVLSGTSAVFNPVTAGTGSHIITYTYTGTGNCSATLQFTIRVLAATKVDLAVAIVTDSKPVGAGEVFNYTVTASNKSTTDATESQTTIKLPEGLSFIDVQTSTGNAAYDQSSELLTWVIGSLSAGKSETLKLNVKAVEPGKYTVTAAISSKEQDATPGDNNSSIDKEILGLFISDVITPNGDGKNDQFTIRGIEMYPVHELNILNRWGNSIYHSTAYKNTWTGEGLNDGTYYYSLRVRTTSGQWQIFKGYVTLLRNR